MPRVNLPFCSLLSSILGLRLLEAKALALMDRIGMMAHLFLIGLLLCEIHGSTSILMGDGMVRCLVLNMYLRRACTSPGLRPMASARNHSMHMDSEPRPICHPPSIPITRITSTLNSETLLCRANCPFRMT